MKPLTLILGIVSWLFIGGITYVAIYSQVPVEPDFRPLATPRGAPPHIQNPQRQAVLSNDAPARTSASVTQNPTPKPPLNPVSTPTPVPIPEPSPTPPPAVSPPTTTPTTTPPVATTSPPIAPTSTATTTPAESSDTSFAQAVEARIHILVNIERQKAWLELLLWSDKLAEVARAHSKDMILNDYFSHDNLDSCNSSCRISNSGYSWRAVGENIYMMSGYRVTAERAAEMIVEGWMESPGHRANILSDAFTEQGVGVYIQGRELYATENFAHPR